MRSDNGGIFKLEKSFDSIYPTTIELIEDIQKKIKMKKKIIIENTFAEAFPMKVSRLIITAHTKKWALEAANSFVGFATSVIACGCEVGIESHLNTNETPDGRPGIFNF